MRCALRIDEPREARRSFVDTRLAYLREAGHDEGVARLLFCRGVLHGDAGRLAASLADFSEAVTLAAPLGDAVLSAHLLRTRGGAHSFDGNYALALEDIRAARVLLLEAGEEALAGRLNFDLGLVYRRLGAPEEALRYLVDEVEAARATGDDLRATMALIQIGFVAFDRGDGAEAELHFREAIALATPFADDALLGNARLALASALNLNGAHAEALAEIDSAQAAQVRIGYVLNNPLAGLQRGIAHAGLGRHRQALEEFATAEPVLVERDQKRLLGVLYPARAASLEAVGRLEDALADWRAHSRIRAELDRSSQRERSDLLRVEFEVAQRELENERLRAEATLQEERYDAIARTRTWQTLSLALAILLGAVLLVAVVMLVLRSRRLQRMAMTDALTGIANRRQIERYLQAQLERSKRTQHPLSVVSLDLDHFKEINDTWGHPTGDVVLQRVCSISAENLLRANDVMGRLGGEEFVLVLPNTPLESARVVAERLRAAVETADMSDLIGQSTVTISLGVATAQPGESIKSLEERVDHALYQAKVGGRNRVEVAGRSVSS